MFEEPDALHTESLTTGQTVLTIKDNGNVGIGTTAPRTILDLGDANLGNEVSGRILTIGRNTNTTTTSAGAVNFLSKGGTNGYVWQDAAGNMRVSASAPTNTNDATSGMVIGTQGSVRDAKQDIRDYTNYDNALQMVVTAPLHYFRYKNEVLGYGSDSTLAKERIGFIFDEVSPMFMWGNSIDQVSVNGILMGSIKAQQDQIDSLKLIASGAISATSTLETAQADPGWLEAIRSAIVSLFEAGIDGIKNFIADNITARQKLCVDDVCVTREEFKQLLDKNGIGRPAPDIAVPSGSEPQGDDGTPEDEPNEPAESSAKAIIFFIVEDSIAAEINETDHTISLTMPSGTDVTALAPVITVSENATVIPSSGEAQDFSNSVTYTVTAQDGTTQDYIVTATVNAPAVEPTVEEPSVK